MMGLTTTYETFSFSGKSENCYGLEIVKNILIRRGYNILPFKPNTQNPVLVSLYWPEQLYYFIKWRYKSCMKDRAVYVGGNYASTSPNAILSFCEGIFLGDGELWDGKPGSKFIINSKTKNPIKKATAKHLTPFLYEDIQQTRRSFIEMSRGCKNKCLFCQYGWLKAYRENNITDIQQIIKRCKTKTIRIFAADRFQHRNYPTIRKIMQGAGKNDSGSDVSIKFILKHPEYLKFTKKVRIGIEGMSYRLRCLVGKKYSDDDVITFCTMVASAGIKSLDFYMIYGLPTETDEDVNCFRKLIQLLDTAMPKGYTIAIHWNAFTPSAQTPFQWQMPAAGKFNELRKLLYFERANKNIKIYHKPKMTSEWTIIRRMLAIRGCKEVAKLIFNFAYKESQFKKDPQFILKEYKKITGADLMGLWPKKLSLPWDKYCIYKKNAMLQLSDRNIKKYGAI